MNVFVIYYIIIQWMANTEKNVCLYSEYRYTKGNNNLKKMRERLKIH